MSAAVFLLPVISLLVGCGAFALGSRLGVMDYPGSAHKTHDRPTPLVGGFSVALPTLVFCALTLWQHADRLVYAALVVAISGAFLLGFFDDRRHLPSLFRLLYGAALALTVIAMVPSFVVPHFDFTFLSEPLWLAPFAIAFSVLVICGMMHATNMMDGLNGLSGGLCLIWVSFLWYYAPPEIVPLLMLLALCLSVTLVFNLKGKLFLGNSGSYALGLAISLLTVYTYNETPIRLPADAVVAWFIVPVVDCLRLMLVRTLRRRSPLSADRNHLHHRLQRLMPGGWAVITIWLMVGLPGLLAMAMPSWTSAAVLSATAIYAGFFALSSDRVSLYRRRAAGIQADQVVGISR